jgi:hypothetical protein
MRASARSESQDWVLTTESNFIGSGVAGLFSTGSGVA